MDEKDRQFIEGLFAKQTEQTEQINQRLDRLEKGMDEFRSGLGEIRGELKKTRSELKETRSELGEFRSELKETREGLVDLIMRAESRLSKKISDLTERVRQGEEKLDVVIDGQKMHAESSERAHLDLKGEIGREDLRVTAVTLDLAAHKADPIAHHRVGVVKEEGEEYDK